MKYFYKLIGLLFFLSASILLNSCSGSFLVQKSAEFENKEWIVQSFDYNDIDNQDGKIFVKFVRSSKRITGFGGCNVILGSYSVTGSDIKIKPSRSKETCPGIMETEDKLFGILEKTSEFREITSSDKEYLRLITPDGSSLELRLKTK